MAVKNYRHPTTTEVAQVWQGAVTTTTNGHTYIITLTDDDGDTQPVTYTVAGSPADTTAVAVAVAAAWNADTQPLVRGITASNSTNTVILTADTAGVPFTAAASGTGTWSGTGNTTEVVSNQSYAKTQNWTDDAVPTTADDVSIVPGTPNKNIIYGLDQSSVAIDEFNVELGCSSNLGRFTDGKLFYLQIDPDSLSYKGSGQLVALNIGSANISPYIESYGSPSAQGRHTVYLQGSNIATLNVARGNVGVAVLEGETTTVATVNINYVTALASDSNVTIGEGVTLTTLNQNAGVALLKCAATTVNNAEGSTLTTEGSGAITTVNAYGTCYLNSTGTITNLNVWGTVDFSKDRSARTITNLNAKPGGKVILHSGITLTNDIVSHTDTGSFTIEYVD